MSVPGQLTPVQNRLLVDPFAYDIIPGPLTGDTLWRNTREWVYLIHRQLRLRCAACGPFLIAKVLNCTTDQLHAWYAKDEPSRTVYFRIQIAQYLGLTTEWDDLSLYSTAAAVLCPAIITPVTADELATFKQCADTWNS